MFRPFKKMKQQMLKERGYKKYFLYVMSEIMLVVIGILIAVQINKWNDHQKKLVLAREFITDLKRDLKNDTMVFGAELRKIEQLIAYKKWGLQNDDNFNGVPGQYIEGLFMSPYHNIKINNLSFQRLKQSEVYSLPKYESFFKRVNVYYTFNQEYLNNFNEWEFEMNGKDLNFWMDQNNFELEMGLTKKDSIGMRQADQIRKQEMIKMMESPQGRNHLKMAFLRENTMKSTYERIYKDAIEIIKKIDEEKK